jgi:7-cyano-7-deazaguanine synthase
MKAEDIKIPSYIKRAAVSISGGLDSTTLTYLLVDRLGPDSVFALSYNYGQKQSYELELAGKTCEKLGIVHKIIDISFLGEIVAPVSANVRGSSIAMPTIKEVIGNPAPPTYVPNRNMILFSIATAFAEVNNCQAVYTGIQTQDQYSYHDTTEAFVDAMNNVNILNRQHYIRLIAPFGRLSKSAEIAIGKDLNVDYSLTLTCYNPDEHGVSCGKCPSCSERIQGFKMNGLVDPAPYAIDIKW